ncbi:MAG: sigma-54 dependent transcriptional regulator [Proteobacteria bacterium]|nr:sigma-54 dependent transcriptional regulator [Pseudomonadota bacterium]
MIIRVALAIKNNKLQHQLEESLYNSDVQIKSYGGTPASWQKLIRSCGDIVVISKSTIPKPIDSELSTLNSLPEKPTIVVIHDSDSSEEHAHLVAAGADVVLYSGITSTSITEAIETTIESRRQLNLMDRFDRQGRVKPKISDFVSFSEEMHIFMDEVAQVIPGNSLILILGETGVGKEHLAKAIHAESTRSSGPFITVNTAALPEQLLESELFGHEQGAFTGAIRSRRGSFELAHGGTIFLDEIGDMPLHLQTKLLRVLQDYEVQPVGGEAPIWVDVRVIAATNKNLEMEVTNGNFRQDLYYRLSVITLTIPPLRKRREDIPAMAHHFINYYKNRIGKEINRIAPSAIDALCRYNWPGNVRELINVIERAMLISKTDEITLNDLPSIFFHTDHSLIEDIITIRDGLPGNLSELETNWEGKMLQEVKNEVMEHIERLYLTIMLKKTKGKVGEAAKISGIHPRGLYSKMKQYNIKKETFKANGL